MFLKCSKFVLVLNIQLKYCKVGPLFCTILQINFDHWNHLNPVWLNKCSFFSKSSLLTFPFSAITPTLWAFHGTWKQECNNMDFYTGKGVTLCKQEKCTNKLKNPPFKFGFLSRREWPQQNETSAHTQSHINLFLISQKRITDILSALIVF